MATTAIVPTWLHVAECGAAVEGGPTVYAHTQR